MSVPGLSQGAQRPRGTVRRTQLPAREREELCQSARTESQQLEGEWQLEEVSEEEVT